MSYEPREENKLILTNAMKWVNSVDYMVSIRWVFYRLLQDSTYTEKAGYKHLVSLLSKARKEFYEEWRPWTLADDTRAPILVQRAGYYGLYLRGNGFESPHSWLETLKQEITCPLDRWKAQPIYAEIYFEAGAMQGQFLYYANENIPLLAFHGDISIPEKWRTAERLAKAWEKYRRPIHIYYFGDFDPKGLTIPKSAWADIRLWAYSIITNKEGEAGAKRFLNNFIFHRVGINQEQIKGMDIPENPERPNTFQWEALTDEQAKGLIAVANEQLDFESFDDIKKREQKVICNFRNSLKGV